MSHPSIKASDEASQMIFLELWLEGSAELGFPPPQVAKQYVAVRDADALVDLFHPRVVAMMKRRAVPEAYVRGLPLNGHGHEPIPRGMSLVDYAKLQIESGWLGMHLGTING